MFPTCGLIPYPSHLPAILQRCYEHCAAEGGATFMGLQYGSQCWCGHRNGGDPTRNGVGRCEYTCPGDGNAMCGESKGAPSRGT